MGGRGRGRGRGIRAKATEPALPGEVREAELGEKMAALGVGDLDQALLPRRPDLGGTLGNKIALIANHFSYELNHHIQVWSYDVTLARLKETGEVATLTFSRDVAFNLFWRFVREFPDKFPNPTLDFPRRMTFDRQKILFSLEPMPERRTELTLDVAGADMRPGKYSLAVVEAVSGVRVLDPRTVAREKDRSTLQMLELLKTEVLKHNDVFFPSGRNFLYLQRSNNPHAVDLGAGRELLRGFYASDKVVDGWKFMLTLDVKATPVLKPLHVLDYVKEVCFPPNAQLPRTLQPQQVAIINAGLKGMKLKMEHNGFSIRCKSLSKQTARDYRFTMIRKEETEQVREMSIEEYFLEAHGRRLMYPEWPLLLKQGGGKETAYPMELCSIYPGQKFPNRKLTPKDHQTIIRATVVDPAVRMRQIEETARVAQLQANAQLIDISLSLELVKLPGRVLDHPDVEYKEARPLNPRDGKWNMSRSRFREGAELKHWVCITFHHNENSFPEQLIDGFCDELWEAGKQIGVQMYKRAGRSQYINPGAPFEQIKAKFQEAKDLFLGPDGNSMLGLIFVILDRENSPLKGGLNLIADCEVGVSMTCVQPDKVKKVMRDSPNKRAQYMSNVLMKINAKLGGVNQHIGLGPSSLKITPDVKKLLMEPVMFLGADVSHPEGGDRTSPSIATLVASVDLHPSRYVGFESLQPNRQETITGLADMVKKALVAYYKRTKAKPTRLIFYRDGIGEGQFRSVIDKETYHKMGVVEVAGVQQACLSVQKDGSYKPPLTFVIVQKRHNTRLFKSNVQELSQQRANIQNIPPGTTVDTTITHPEEFDFYLCSHEGIQGTSRPTHYHVLWDDNKLSSNTLQGLTFALCHSYARCTRSVSLPPPVYYADLIASRAALRLHHITGSESGTELSESSIEENLTRLRDKIKVHANVENTMYWV